MSDEVRAERAPEGWPNIYGRYGVRVRGYGCDSFVFFVRESDAEAFIAKVNGTGLRIVDAAGNLPPWPDLTELRGALNEPTTDWWAWLVNIERAARDLVERHR
jgi:hypothetical protein